MTPSILTKKEATVLAGSQKRGFGMVSVDLGKSKTRVEVTEKGALIDGQLISIKELSKTKENTCYVAQEGELKAVELFSQSTNLYYKLVPTQDWPTVMLSSVPMHRFKTITPKKSAQIMVNELGAVKGVALDTCCGLGYTATLVANQVGCEKVHTFERDENVLTIAGYNPWSQGVFTNPKVILHKENVAHGIKELESNSFDCVIHDPPTVSFSPQLYEAPFYAQLLRVMKSGAKLYHYCPTPGKTKGNEFWPGVKRKLEELGFVGVEFHKKASGIVANKK